MPKIISKRVVKGQTFDEAGAEALFDKISAFAQYGFNRSHSVEYSLISFQAMWLKTYYPVEFFASALSLMDSDKLPDLLREAEGMGIQVDMPDINTSTDRFEILSNTQIVVPFQRIKGISTTAAAAIAVARKDGPFKSRADFEARIERRKCNIRAINSLDLVGAFASVEPGQPSSRDPARIVDQVDLVPGLVSRFVPIARAMHQDPLSRDAVAEVLTGVVRDHPEALIVPPLFGKTARFVIILDAPSKMDEDVGVLGQSRSSESVSEAMEDAGLVRHDAFWTSIVRQGAKAKDMTPTLIKSYSAALERELEILKPTVIVLLGTQAMRTFLPDLKGKASDNAGQVIYDKVRDCNIVVGFNPGEIYHDPSKQDVMNALFKTVNQLL